MNTPQNPPKLPVNQQQIPAVDTVPSQFDPNEFRPFLKECNFSHEQETELLQSIWIIVCACAEVGYKGDPVELIFQERAIDEITKEGK